MNSVVFNRTNEEIEPLCRALDFTPQDTVLSVCSGWCIPIFASQAWSKITAIDTNESQIEYAKKRVERIISGCESVWINYTDEHKSDMPNKIFSERQFSNLWTNFWRITWQVGCVFHEWMKNIDSYNRVYLSSVLALLPPMIGNSWERSPEWTLVYIASYGNFDGSLAWSKLKTKFLDFFAEDEEKTSLARKRKADDFWDPVVYRKK